MAGNDLLVSLMSSSLSAGPKRLCYVSLDYDTGLKSTSKSFNKIHTYELPDRNIISLGAERFRYTMFSCQFSLAWTLLSREHEVLRELPQKVIRQCCVAKRQDFETEVSWADGEILVFQMGWLRKGSSIYADTPTPNPLPTPSSIRHIVAS